MRDRTSLVIDDIEQAPVPLATKLPTINDHVPDLKTEGQLQGDEFAVDTKTNCAWLFHGTSAKAAEAITTADFLVNLAGSHVGTLFGPGIYLAECCSKSDEYATPDAEGLCCILLCRTILGNMLIC